MKTTFLIGSLAFALLAGCLTALPADAGQANSGKGNNLSALTHRHEANRLERRHRARRRHRHQARRFRQERRHRIERQALRHHGHRQ